MCFLHEKYIYIVNRNEENNQELTDKYEKHRTFTETRDIVELLYIGQ